MSDQINALNAAIAAARSAAATAVPAAAPAFNTPVAAHPASQVPATRPVSMREMLAESGMAVDKYIKVTPAGFDVADDLKNLVDEFFVDFKLSDAKPFYAVRFGNPAKYMKSFDRMYDSRTKKPWIDVVAAAQAQDPKCSGDYRSVDIPFTHIDDIKSVKDSKVLFEKGKRLGWTCSVTNWRSFQEFISPYYDLMDAGVIPENATVRGRIYHESVTKNGNTWGLLRFGDFEIVGLGTPEEQAA